MPFEWEKFEIHCTMVGSCMYTYYLDSYSDNEPLPPHYLSLKGRTIHSLIEEWTKKICIENEEPKLEYDISGIPEHSREEYIEEVGKIFGNFIDFYNSEKDIFKDVLSVEERLKTSYTVPDIGEIEIVVTPDFVTKTHVVDWKTGKKAYFDRYKWQLMVGIKASKEKFGGDREGLSVFLGGNKYEVLELSKTKDIKKLEDNFLMELARTYADMDLIKKGIAPKPQIGYNCVFCTRIHECRGYIP